MATNPYNDDRPMWKKRTVAVAAMVMGALTACAAKPQDFQGKWVYKQACGQYHVAEVKLTQSGNDVSGEWSDGNQHAGADGKLEGHVRGEKLFVRYCGNDEQAGYAVCPKYESDETDYFVRQGKELIWYQMIGKKSDNTFRKYVILHPVSGNESTAMDAKCEHGA